MPATAGRVRMPANNRVHSSAALQTHGIWQSAIGYDPYAPNKEDSKASSQPKSANAEPEGDNPYTSFQGLMTLARISSFNPDESRGACKRCGRVGHLPFQCRNFLSVKEDKEKDQDLLQAPVLSGLDKFKGNGKIIEESEEGEESETTDSEVDSEIERIIAERYGKKKSSKRRSSKRKDDSDEDGSDSDSGGRKRGRSKKRRSKKRDSSDSESEDEEKRKRKKREKRRKRDESSSEEEQRRRHKRKSRKEKRRRRSHRYSDDSDTDASEDSGRRNRRKSRKATSAYDSGVSDSDDSRIGRGTKRTEKKGKKRHHEESV